MPDDLAASAEGPDPEPLHELTIGRPRPPFAEARRPPAADGGPDLARVEARCRLKAEAARRAADRLRRVHEWDQTPASGDPEVAAWAEALTDAYYWRDAPSDPSLLDDVGGCFEAVAGAVALARGAAKGRLDQALPLVAQAQSAARGAVKAVGGADDPDQLAVFEWVKAEAARHHVYIKRHMRADDPADPARWRDLLDRIERADPAHGPARHAPLIERARRHLAPIREGRGSDDDWREVVGAVEAMVGAGVAPSNREVRELLLPVVDDLPDRDDLPEGFGRVLREVDRFLATRAAPAPPAPASTEPTAEVREARRLLAGRGAVLIGGACRREAQGALEEALGLSALTWIETREHQPVASFEPAVSRPDVAVVLLAIRWSSHAFGDVRRLCDRHGKALVRLPGGYNPNQVAAQVVAQCGERLGGG